MKTGSPFFRTKLFHLGWFLLLLLTIVGMIKLYKDFQVSCAHTGIKNIVGFYFFLVVWIATLLSLLFQKTKLSTATKQKVVMVLASIAITWIGMELTLRIFQINATGFEKKESAYVSPYIRVDTDTLHIILPNYPPFLKSPEFNYSRKRNNLGFRDIDFLPKKDSSEILIQTYGDSFTEGDGAPMDSSYPSHLRKFFWQQVQPKIVVQNFGICGSDPAFSYKQFQHIGVTLKPDIIVIAYCTYDLIFDFYTRGGLERFQGNHLEGRQAPWWEIIYAYSYIFRTLIIATHSGEYNRAFVGEKVQKEIIHSMEAKWNEVFLQIASMATKQHIKVMLLKKPESDEIESKKYNYDFSFFEKMVDTIPVFQHFDLLPFYTDTLGLNKRNTAPYYWKQDGHHNGKGYYLMAKGVESALHKNYPEIFQK